MSDGLTVPFALAAGFSGAVAVPHVIVTAGLAEIAAGSIAMGLGGYLAARSDAEHYASERSARSGKSSRCRRPRRRRCATSSEAYGLAAEESAPVVAALQPAARGMGRLHDALRVGAGGARPGGRLKSALTIAGSYIVGGLIPLGPTSCCRRAPPCYGRWP